MWSPGHVTRHKSGLGSDTRYAVCRGSTPLAVLCIVCSWRVGRGGVEQRRIVCIECAHLTVRRGGTVVSDGSWCYHYQLHTSWAHLPIVHGVLLPLVWGRVPGPWRCVRGNSAVTLVLCCNYCTPNRLHGLGSDWLVIRLSALRHPAAAEPRSTSVLEII